MEIKWWSLKLLIYAWSGFGRVLLFIRKHIHCFGVWNGGGRGLRRERRVGEGSMGGIQVLGERERGRGSSRGGVVTWVRTINKSTLPIIDSCLSHLTLVFNCFSKEAEFNYFDLCYFCLQRSSGTQLVPTIKCTSSP